MMMISTCLKLTASWKHKNLSSALHVLTTALALFQHIRGCVWSCSGFNILLEPEKLWKLQGQTELEAQIRRVERFDRCYISPIFMFC